jgi:hypothetical protein
VARQQVLGEQQFAGATLESTKVNSSTLKGHATLAETADLPNWHKEIAPFDADDGADNRRVRVVTEARDQILDATDPVTVLIEDGTAKKRGEVEDFCHCYAFRTP